MMNTILQQHHAHLWISDQVTLQTFTTQQLQKLLCLQSGCQKCTTCKLLADQLHPWVYYVNPEGSYTVDDIDDILDQTKFQLNNHEYRIFVLHHAHDLTVASSNRLLKTIEEPHQNYIFILLASRTDTILPTIISRCLIQEFSQNTTHHEHHEILKPFIDQNFTSPAQFLKILEKADLNESSSREMIDLLAQHYHQLLTQLHQQPELNIKQIIEYLHILVIIQEQFNQLPAQGSSKLFWKNLFLTFHQQTL